jgi:hypothetical protein
MWITLVPLLATCIPFNNCFVSAFLSPSHSVVGRSFPFPLTTKKTSRPYRRPERTIASINDTTTVEISSIEDSLLSLGIKTSIKILSTDPLVYIIPNFLSIDECESFVQYVQEEHDNNGRIMMRSNPPKVSLDVRKLSPLLLLSLLSGIPPYLREIESTNGNVDVSTVLSPIALNVITCLALMALLAYGIILPLLTRIANKTSRTSDAIALNMDRDVKLIYSFVERATLSVSAKWLRHQYSWQNWEAPVVTKYNIGAVFARHGDASPTRGSEWNENGGQRLVTCICYLNTLNEGMGGETYFDKLKLRIRPQLGTALFFYPADPVSKEADDRTTHESCPPANEKWIVQLFGRSENVPPPLGLPNTIESSSYSKCTGMHDCL